MKEKANISLSPTWKRRDVADWKQKAHVDLKLQTVAHAPNLTEKANISLLLTWKMRPNYHWT